VILSIVQLEKTYRGGVKAVRDVSFDVDAGELLALVGESGCGKTTTLKCINRLLEPSSGRVLVEDEDAAGLDPVSLRRRIGWVMQGDGLFPHMSVGDNVAVTLRLLGWTPQHITQRVDEMLELVRLDPAQFRNRRPGTLSGGQRQRVGVARALAAGSNLVLMDEPFGALDPITRDALRRDFIDLQKRMGFAAVMVTHDMAEALLMADRIAVMHEGAIVQSGAPQALLNAPGHAIVRTMLESPLHEADAVQALKSEAERGDV
jgi:osmoprotectant transport system ATP-binding protein